MHSRSTGKETERSMAPLSSTAHSDVLLGRVSFQHTPPGAGGSGVLECLAGARGTGMLGIAPLQTQHRDGPLWRGPLAVSCRVCSFAFFGRKNSVTCLRSSSQGGERKRLSGKQGQPRSKQLATFTWHFSTRQCHPAAGDPKHSLVLGPRSRGGKVRLLPGTVGGISSQCAVCRRGSHKASAEGAGTCERAGSRVQAQTLQAAPSLLTACSCFLHLLRESCCWRAPGPASAITCYRFPPSGPQRASFTALLTPDTPGGQTEGTPSDNTLLSALSQWRPSYQDNVLSHRRCRSSVLLKPSKGFYAIKENQSEVPGSWQRSEFGGPFQFLVVNTWQAPTWFQPPALFWGGVDEAECGLASISPKGQLTRARGLARRPVPVSIQLDPPITSARCGLFVHEWLCALTEPCFWTPTFHFHAVVTCCGHVILLLGFSSHFTM